MKEQSIPISKLNLSLEILSGDKIFVHAKIQMIGDDGRFKSSGRILNTGTVDSFRIFNDDDGVIIKEGDVGLLDSKKHVRLDTLNLSDTDRLEISGKLYNDK